jgi:hypothetical protein
VRPACSASAKRGRTPNLLKFSIRLFGFVMRALKASSADHYHTIGIDAVNLKN